MADAVVTWIEGEYETIKQDIAPLAPALEGYVVGFLHGLAKEVEGIVQSDLKNLMGFIGTTVKNVANDPAFENATGADKFKAAETLILDAFENVATLTMFKTVSMANLNTLINWAYSAFMAGLPIAVAALA